MKVDAPGLIAAAQRLLAVVEALGGSGVPHAPLAADPASIGAATRLTTAGEELTAALTAHITALVETIEYLTGTVITFVETDANNAAAIATLNKGGAVAAGVGGSAPPAPPVAPDVRVPIGPPPPMPPEVISVAVHTGNSSGGEPFINAWSRVATATHDASQMIRDSVQQLPETLDGPVSTPAVSHHLLKFAKGLETYSQRAQTLVKQANDHADNQFQVRQAVPTPQQFTNAQQRVHAIAVANAASGGKHAPQLAQAVSDKTKLDTQAVTNYPPYHVRTVANTNGDDPGAAPTDQPAADPTDQDPTTPKTPGDPTTSGPDDAEGLGPADPSSDPLPEESGGPEGLIPQLLPALLEGAGGLIGGAVGAVMKGPQALLQAGEQAIQAATQGLSGLGQPKMDPPEMGHESAPDGGDPAGGGGDPAPTTPASGAGELSVAPSTGAPPTPAVTPVGAVEGSQPGGAAPAGGGPMGMPMGGMGGFGGAPGGSGAGKGDRDRERKVIVRDIPHTEDVTGRVDTNRLSAAAAATQRDRHPEPPDDDDPPDPATPVVRRLVTRPPREPS